ncbi:hypothetical protein GCM10022384_53770 [Streptomyces marokkonensis]|uniref:Secreted protein n=1 Tax=Streptomyces marokkonensis TaxID=324855 RepID=A0ABP7RND2_9ACTN
MIVGAAGASAVAEVVEAAVSPAASAEAPVAVTTERREGRVTCGTAGRGDVSRVAGAGCRSPPAAWGVFPDCVLSPEVCAF